MAKKCSIIQNYFKFTHSINSYSLNNIYLYFVFCNIIFTYIIQMMYMNTYHDILRTQYCILLVHNRIG